MESFGGVDGSRKDKECSQTEKMFVARREIKTTNASTVSNFEGDKSRRQEVHNFQSMSTAQQGATVKLRNKKRPSENQQINNQE